MTVGMRILVISNLYPPAYVGGYELGCSRVVRALSQKGHTIAVLTSGGLQSVEQDHAETVLRKLILRKPPNAAAMVGDHNTAVLQATLRTFRPDLVYGWNLEHLGTEFLMALEGLAIPRAYFVSDLWMTRERARATKTTFRESFLRIGSTFRRKRTSAFRAKFHNLQFCSRAVADQVTRRDLAAGTCRVIHWGVKEQDFRIDRGDKAHGGLRLLYAGQLERHKGVHTALRAFSKIVAKVPNAQLTVAGSGADAPYARLLRRLARDVPGVTFRGKIAAEDMPRLYQMHDVLLFTSEWFEPFALTPLEAMAAGMAVVATPTGGTTELLTDGVNTLLFTPGGVRQCARQVLRLIREPTLYARLSRSGTALVSTAFTLDAMVKKIEEHLAQVIDTYDSANTVERCDEYQN